MFSDTSYSPVTRQEFTRLLNDFQILDELDTVHWKYFHNLEERLHNLENQFEILKEALIDITKVNIKLTFGLVHSHIKIVDNEDVENLAKALERLELTD